MPCWRVGLIQCLSVWGRHPYNDEIDVECPRKTCQVILHSDMADDVIEKFGHVPQQALDLGHVLRSPVGDWLGPRSCQADWP